VPASVVSRLTAEELANNTILTGTDCGAHPENCTRRFVTIPPRVVNPFALNLLNAYYPHPNPSAPLLNANAAGQNTTGRVADFAQSFGGLLTRDLATLRVDHDFSDKDQLYAVYNFHARNRNRGLLAKSVT